MIARSAVEATLSARLVPGGKFPWAFGEQAGLATFSWAGIRFCRVSGWCVSDFDRQIFSTNPHSLSRLYGARWKGRRWGSAGSRKKIVDGVDMPCGLCIMAIFRCTNAAKQAKLIAL